MSDGTKEGDLTEWGPPYRKHSASMGDKCKCRICLNVPDDLRAPDKLGTLAEALEEAVRLHGDDEVMLHMYVSFFLLPLYDPKKKAIVPIDDELS